VTNLLHTSTTTYHNSYTGDTEITTLTHKGGGPSTNTIGD